MAVSLFRDKRLKSGDEGIDSAVFFGTMGNQMLVVSHETPYTVSVCTKGREKTLTLLILCYGITIIFHRGCPSGWQ